MKLALAFTLLSTFAAHAGFLETIEGRYEISDCELFGDASIRKTVDGAMIIAENKVYPLIRGAGSSEAKGHTWNTDEATKVSKYVESENNDTAKTKIAMAHTLREIDENTLEFELEKSSVKCFLNRL